MREGGTERTVRSAKPLSGVQNLSLGSVPDGAPGRGGAIGGACRPVTREKPPGCSVRSKGKRKRGLELIGVRVGGGVDNKSSLIGGRESSGYRTQGRRWGMSPSRSLGGLECTSDSTT